MVKLVIHESCLTPQTMFLFCKIYLLDSHFQQENRVFHEDFYHWRGSCLVILSRQITSTNRGLSQLLWAPVVVYRDLSVCWSSAIDKQLMSLKEWVRSQPPPNQQSQSQSYLSGHINGPKGQKSSPVTWKSQLQLPTNLGEISVCLRMFEEVMSNLHLSFTTTCGLMEKKNLPAAGKQPIICLSAISHGVSKVLSYLLLSHCTRG